MRRMNKILALFVLSGGLLHAENLVFNGDFELGVCGFALERFQRPDTNPELDFRPLAADPAERFAGRQALRVENPYAERGIVYSREFRLKPDTVYYLRGAIKCSADRQPIRIDLINRTIARGPHSVTGSVKAGSGWTRFEIPLNTKDVGGMYHLKVFVPARKLTIWLDDLSVSSGKDTRFTGVEMGITADSRLYVAGETGKSRCTVRLRNTGDSVFEKTVRLVMTDDYFGTSVPAAEFPCRINPGEVQSFTVEIPLARMGSFRIESADPGEFRFFPGYFAVVGKLDRRPYDSKRFCVGFNGGIDIRGRLEEPPGLQVSNASAKEKFRLLSHTGCRVLRGHDCGDLWYYVEPEPGKFDFRWLELGLKLLNGHGISYLPVLGGNCFYINTASWAPKAYPLWFEQIARKGKTVSKGHPMLIPPDAVWRRYVNSIVKQAGERIMQYEIFNEAQFQVSPEMYNGFLKSAYEEIRKENPRARIVGFCSTSDKGEDIGLFARRCFELGGLELADAVSFHPYASRELGSVEPADRQIASLKGLIRKHNRKTPVWNTELYYLFDGPEMKNYFASGDASAHHAAWRFLVDLGEGVEQSYPLHEDQLWKELLIPGYEHVTSRPELYPSPLVPAYNALARFFEGAEALHKFQFPEGIVCYVYRKDGAPVAAVWNFRKQKFLKFDLSGFEVYDLFGNPVPAGIRDAGPVPFYLKPGKLTEAEFIKRLKTLSISWERSVTASPEARLVSGNGKLTLWVGLRNRTTAPVAGFLGINSGGLSAVAPVPFTLDGGEARTVELPVRETETGEPSVLKLYVGEKSREVPLKIHRSRIQCFRKPFTMKSPDGKLSADGRIFRENGKTVFEFLIRDVTDSGAPGKRQLWEQDCVEFFLDPAPRLLPEYHPNAWHPGMIRLFVMPRWKSGRVIVWKNTYGLTPEQVPCTVAAAPDSCRVRLELPERVTGTEFGLEIKINDASGDRIADRSALLFGAEFAYRDRLVFGIVKEDDAELPASSAVSGASVLKPGGGWKTVSPGVYEIRYDGKRTAHLSGSAPVRPDSYYRLRWIASSENADCLKTGVMIRLNGGEPFYIGWNPAAAKAPRSVSFHSGSSDKVDFSLYLPRTGSGVLRVEQVCLERLSNDDLRKNLFPNHDFESDGRLPGDWMRDWKQKEAVSFVVPASGFYAGKRSLALCQKEGAVEAGINSAPLPVLPGKTYRLAFWAKSEGPVKLSAVFDLPNYGKKWKHFQKRKTFLLTPDWKRYSFEVTLPEDVREWPALEKRTGRISFLLERRKPGRVLLDQLDFRMTENQKNP